MIIQFIENNNEGRTLEAENIELRDMLAAERQVNFGLTGRLTALNARHVISDCAARANRKEISDAQTALAQSRVEAEAGQTDLAASAAALASSQAETRVGHAELVASAAELASSRAETSEGQVGLAASGAANEVLKLANILLETNEAVLRELVEERTAALMREVEERHRAEEALHRGEKLQMIGQITGSIAHDFNNILQVVVGGVELLRRPKLTHEHHAIWLERIDKAAESAKLLINRLLIFARKETLQPKVFDLNERLAEMSELLGPTLGPNIRLENNFAPDLWPVMADPGQLEVAILNLAVNARDAMSLQGGVLTFQTSNVTLEATSERVAGDYIRLAVRDTGTGMSPAVMAQVFEPFFTTKGIGKGTGLGLAQVHGFARQSGGDVTAESAPGQGTTIFFNLLRPAAAELASAAKQEGQRGVGASRFGSGKTVLVVEDNLDLASLAVSMLEGHGYATESAANAAEALARLDAGDAVDCVFSDIVMPGPMNGLQLASMLRLRHPRLAVVLSTGYSQALTENGDQVVAEVLSKPYRGHELMAALDRAFSDIGMAGVRGGPAPVEAVSA